VLICGCAAVGMELAHLCSIQHSGSPIRWADWLSHVLGWVAQFGSAALLVLLGWGWTLCPDQMVLGHLVQTPSASRQQHNGGTGQSNCCSCRCICAELRKLGPAAALFVLGTAEATLALHAKAVSRSGMGMMNVHHDFESWSGMAVREGQPPSWQATRYAGYWVHSMLLSCTLSPHRVILPRCSLLAGGRPPPGVYGAFWLGLPEATTPPQSAAHGR
jgi:hypothetical protein